MTPEQVHHMQAMAKEFPIQFDHERLDERFMVRDHPFVVNLCYEAGPSLVDRFNDFPVWHVQVGIWGQGEAGTRLEDIKNLTGFQSKAVERLAFKVLDGVGTRDNLWPEASQALLSWRVPATIREAQDVAFAYSQRKGPPVMLGPELGGLPSSPQ